MEDKTVIAVIAISAITAIEVTALYMGMNGVVLALSLAAIAGVGGYELKNLESTITGEGKTG